PPPASTVSPFTRLVVRGQWLLRADLRDRLVPGTAAGNRFLGGFPGRLAWYLHGRDVPGEYRLAAFDLAAVSSSARLRLAGTGPGDHRHRCAVWDALCGSLLYRS